MSLTAQMNRYDTCASCGLPVIPGLPCDHGDSSSAYGATDRSVRRSALADAAAEIADMERKAKEPYATAYRKAKDRILAMIVQ